MTDDKALMLKEQETDRQARRQAARIAEFIAACKPLARALWEKKIKKKMKQAEYDRLVRASDAYHEPLPADQDLENP